MWSYSLTIAFIWPLRFSVGLLAMLTVGSRSIVTAMASSLFMIR